MLKKTLDWKNASWSSKPAGAIARGELPHEDECDHNFTSDDADGEEDDDICMTVDDDTQYPNTIESGLLVTLL